MTDLTRVQQDPLSEIRNLHSAAEVLLDENLVQLDQGQEDTWQ